MEKIKRLDIAFEILEKYFLQKPPEKLIFLTPSRYKHVRVRIRG